MEKPKARRRGPMRCNPITLEAIYREKIFEATSLRQPEWLKDGLHFSFLDNAPGTEIPTVWVYDVTTGQKEAVVPASALEGSGRAGKADEKSTEKAAGIQGYQWSPDETRLLLGRTPRWRAAGGEQQIHVYTLADSSLKQVAPTKEEHRGVKWAPDGQRIGYVRGDDIFVLDLTTGHENRLTDTAQPLVYNGRFGWVYEEELDLVDGWLWAPDGKSIAYYQVDERPVPEIDLPNYDDLHMAPVRTRYPKAGDPNPTVKIGVVDAPPAGQKLETVPQTRWVDTGADTDVYIARMQFTPGGQLLLQRIPRLQNRIDVMLADPVTGASRVLFTEQDAAWVDCPGDLQFPSPNEVLWPSDRSGFQHLFLYKLDGSLVRQVTDGDWDVDTLAGVDKSHRVVYFTAARPSPMQRQIFSTLLDGGAGIQQISEQPGVHSANFAPDCRHYLGTFSSRSIAPKTRLHHSSGREVDLVHDNAMPKLQQVKLGQWEFFSFETPDHVTLNGAMLKPQDFDPAKKYPVLMYTYGGPGSQVVMDQYGSGGGLEQLLASHGFLFAMVDGRGSGFRGREFKKCTYLNLGHYEVEDQVAAAKWLAKQPYVDGLRIGIWGWSYGGYMASRCILLGADVFKAAAAVAPVTQWGLYDTIYTERYMRRPADNPEGYEKSSATAYAADLKGAFLVLHGMADDNVHFQNTARLVERLQKENKTFRMMAYPGKHHGIEGVGMHVFATIIGFLEQELGGKLA